MGIVSENYGEMITGMCEGIGRMFLYYQTCSKDTSDNYSANCFSDLNWGVYQHTILSVIL